MTDHELLELIAAQVDKLTSDMAKVKADLGLVKNTVLKIESDCAHKLDALQSALLQKSVN